MTSTGTTFPRSWTDLIPGADTDTWFPEGLLYLIRGEA